MSSVSDTKLALYSSMGYFTCQDLNGTDDEKWFTNYMTLNSVLNGVGVLLSPLVGIVRIIAALVTFIFVQCKKDPEDDTIKLGKKMIAFEMGRGALELLCLGPILGIADAVVTCWRYEMLCFKKA